MVDSEPTEPMAPSIPGFGGEGLWRGPVNGELLRHHADGTQRYPVGRVALVSAVYGGGVVIERLAPSSDAERVAVVHPDGTIENIRWAGIPSQGALSSDGVFCASTAIGTSTIAPIHLTPSRDATCWYGRASLVERRDVVRICADAASSVAPAGEAAIEADFGLLVWGVNEPTLVPLAE